MRKRTRKRNPEEPQRGYHSWFYHHYFAGYSERYVVKNGKRKIERVYTGEKYRPELNRRRRLLMSFLYTVLLFMGIFSFFKGSTVYIESNTFALVILLEGFQLVFMIWNVVALVRYWLMKSEMKIYEFSGSSKAIKTADVTNAICAGLLAITTILYSVVIHSPYLMRAFGAALSFLVSACFFLAVFLLESRQKYQVIMPETTEEEDLTPIND